MPRVKIKRSKPTLDMTPMVDLAFLLVTFFMLTTKFAPDDAVIVDTPTSVSEIKIPESNVITIAIDKDNRVFYGVDGQQTREKLLDKIGQKYGVTFNEDQRKAFSLTSNFGVPVRQLPGFLSMGIDDRKKVNQPGIPIDSLNNELSEWVWQTRLTNPQVIVAIKGDVDANFTTINKIIKTLEERKVSRFNLITDMEARPTSL
ncbi:biopolymer transporter ExbD [Pontibacter qinzhouensis]|uniref:Biopolymer transporter ExbD n=1 Tax=Pontibacter qinzhouensis TaxID=2603253 RepID=A0A5C8JHW3_9BACT|nr:biopolymer transporter ExbD [Pontibacter qinzhouensis]TXK36646.1 biopolymer transporter ExbD [Pontibacter qinzhouensis]